MMRYTRLMCAGWLLLLLASGLLSAAARPAAADAVGLSSAPASRRLGPAGPLSQPQRAVSTTLPVSQTTKLSVTPPNSEIWFGFSVAVSGDIAVVGANKADINGNLDMGAAYVFYRNTNGVDGWGLVKQLTPPDGAALDEFGSSVAISGDIIIVGSYMADHSSISNAGAAYVFRRNQGGINAWGLAAKLTAPDSGVNQSFGHAVAVSGETVVVGVPKAAGGGAAYVYGRNQGGADAWGIVKRVTGSDTVGGNAFGFSVALSGDILVAGAESAVISGTVGQGAAYVFYRNNGGADVWGQQRKLVAPDGAASDQFGHAVGVSGDTIIVGAWKAMIGASAGQGAAYIFVRNLEGPSAWGLQKKLTAADGTSNQAFGSSVTISDDAVIVGSRQANVGGHVQQGNAYLYERNLGGADLWGEAAVILADDGTGSDWFGHAVSLSGNTIIIGAYVDLGAGSAYMYSRSIGGWVQRAKPTVSGASGDRVGSATALDNDTLVVGADSFDGVGVDSGAVYIFERNTTGGDSWGLLKTITAPDAAAGDVFGRSVGIADDIIVVGAPNKNGGQGAIYIFERNLPTSDAWGWKTTLAGTAGARLGTAVAISGDRVAAGAPTPSGAGAVLIYDRNQGGPNAWGQSRRIDFGGVGDQFGAALDLHHSTLVVGAPYADPAGMSNAGSAAIFERNSGGADSWGVVRELTPTTRLADDHLGTAVAIDDDTVLIGAPDVDSAAGVDAGAAYVFLRNQGGVDGWGQRAVLADVQGAAGDRLGFSVALFGDMALVGSPRVQASGHANRGAALVFERNVGGGDAWGRMSRLLASGGQAEDRFGFSVTLGSAFLAVGAIQADGGSAANQGAAYVFRASAVAPDTTGGTSYLPLLGRFGIEK